MNQKAIDYLKVNKEKYTQEILIRQLQNSGYSQADIMEAVGVVFGAENAKNGSAATSNEAITEIKYAGFWIRYAAVFLDGILINIVYYAIAIPFGLVSFSVADPEKINSGGLWLYPLMWAYYIFMTNKYQATLGKMALGLQVVSEDGERASLGKIVIREIPGKILSQVTFLIGYIMAGFTAKKQALHDKLAGTVVVYKDPQKKVKTWVIGVVVLIFGVFMVAIIGILSSIVLVSLNSAKNKAQDVAVEKNILAYVPQAIMFYDLNESFSGFKPKAISERSPLECLGADPIVRVAPDGQQVAIFGKLCAAEKKYFCADANGNPEIASSTAEVDEAFVLSGKTTCR